MNTNKIKSNALSFFNGIGGAKIICDMLGFKFDNFYVSEIDKNANKAAFALNPDCIQMGDVTKWREWDIDWKTIDLLLGGSPCQGFSLAGLQAGTKAILNGEEVLVTDRETYLEMKAKGAEFLSQSHLFWEYILCLDHVKLHNPDVKFMLENVKMKKELLEMITGAIGVEPICINSRLTSPQNRVRYYWTNIGKVEQPKDAGIFLIDILEDLPSCPIGIAVREKSKCVRVGGRRSPFDSKQEWDSPFYRVTKKGKIKPGIDKAACLTGGAHSGGNHSDMDILVIKDTLSDDVLWRRYSLRECCRLMSMPERHIDTLLSTGISNTQLYKMIANGWELNAVIHVLKGFV